MYHAGQYITLWKVVPAESDDSFVVEDAKKVFIEQPECNIREQRFSAQNYALDIHFVCTLVDGENFPCWVRQDTQEMWYDATLVYAEHKKREVAVRNHHGDVIVPEEADYCHVHELYHYGQCIDCLLELHTI